MNWVQILQNAGGVILALVIIYMIWKFYQTRVDFTYMTHNDQGFKRALRGRGFIIDPEEFIVRGAGAPRIEFVALDPASGQRKLTPLMDRHTGAVNLRPQYCVPLPFAAITADNHKVMVEARVQFSLNRDRMFFVYHVQDFGLALETRIQSALRAEIGKRRDEELRASLNEVEDASVRRLRQGEEEGDEIHEPGVALGANFHTVSFTYTAADEFAAAAIASPLLTAGGAPLSPAEAAAAAERARAIVRASGALALKPQQLDQMADVFRNRDPASTAAILTILEMQTRQNIAEALAATGQLIVLTPQELGLAGAAVLQREASGRGRGEGALLHPNGGARPDARA